jgi:uncharacterized protein YecT (DUF1311 family)
MKTSVIVRCSVVVFASLLIHTWALAQHMNAPGVPCNRPSTTAEEASCFQRSSETADRELNRVYARVRSALSFEEQKDLRVAEQYWMKYRDATCKAEYNLYGGGTAGPVTRMACLTAITQQRVVTLNTTYGWRVGKLAR